MAITYPGLSTLDIKFDTPNLLKQPPLLNSLLFPPLYSLNKNYYNPFKVGTTNYKRINQLFLNDINNDWNNSVNEQNELLKNPSLIKQIGGAAVNAVTHNITDELFDDSEFGRGLGTLFSSGVNSATNTMTDNLIKGKYLTEGLSKNVGASIGGTAAGLVANLIGTGISSLMGNSRLGQSIGSGLSVGLGSVGGLFASNLLTKGTAGVAFGGTGILSDMSKMSGAINPYALGTQVLGAALGAAGGQSKEYGGKYGGITRTMDTIYDTAMAGANFIPGVGQGISGIMALNKGLSNIFGSTDGITKTDAILGSAFMPAPVKWVNMIGASKTGTFNNLSWLNSERTESFMGNAFGNLGDRLDQARLEAGKTYGTFSQGAKRRALENINFANQAWTKLLAMTDLNELQNIRSQYMSSINNLRYAQSIGGSWSPLARGKQGMKIFNNATNHDMAMRLLSGAALIDNKQMILCSVQD